MRITQSMHMPMHRVLNAVCITADTAKERSAYEKKMRTDKKAVEDLVQRHNQLAPFGTQQPPLKVTVEQMLQATFPWAGDGAVQGAPLTCLDCTGCI